MHVPGMDEMLLKWMACENYTQPDAMMMMNDFQRRLYEMQQKKRVIQTPADTEALAKFWLQHQVLLQLLAQLDASKDVEVHASVANVFIELMKRGTFYQNASSNIFVHY